MTEALSQLVQAASRDWKRQGTHSPLGPPDGAQARQHFDFRAPDLQNCELSYFKLSSLWQSLTAVKTKQQKNPIFKTTYAFCHQKDNFDLNIGFSYYLAKIFPPGLNQNASV